MAENCVDNSAVAGGQQLLVQDDSADAGGKQTSNLQPLFFPIYIFLASGAVAGQAGRGERGSRGQQDSATRDLRGAQVC